MKTMGARSSLIAHEAIGNAALRVSGISMSLLLLTLPWGPHWPFRVLGIDIQGVILVTTGFNIADLLVAILLLSWLVALWSGWATLVWRPLLATEPLIALCIAALLAVATALHRQEAWSYTVRTICLAGCYLYLRSRPLQPERAILLLIPGLIVNALLAVAQMVHQNPLGLTWLGEPQMYRTTSGTSTIFSGGQLILRPYGLLPHANVLGGLLAAALPLVFSVLYSPPGSGRSRRALYWHYLRVGTIIATLVLVIAALALSYSRSAWIGLVAALLYVMWRYRIHWNFSRRTMHIAAISSLLVALMVGLQWNVVAARLIPRQRTEVLSIQQRLFLLNLTLHVIAWRPLTGVGGNNLVYGEARFRPKAVGSTTGILPVHNTYLLAEAELGPLGGIAWLALMLVPISGLWLEATAIRRRRTTNGRRAPPTRPAIVATRSSRAIIHDSNEQLNIFAGAALIVVAVAGLFDFYITANEPVALLWIVSLALFAQSGPQEAGVARYNR